MSEKRVGKGGVSGKRVKEGEGRKGARKEERK